ncbi:hypothetical protein HNQ07_002265 [Deinococcus metalli]|uniref:Tryptophan-rich sensory protein n=1 Tax=Deinococcus metalli TaxID=1141878 RepID=A0A7W8KGX7_9DEIO|nr:tryptophan-rich sensory protein [Deinococcus metalli]MBB5376801.1 hypothetical protein [Deinococcus metalli]GHF45445.1 hypothetical protein GCM10017781_22300 [Deinococcus metalli]
MNRLPLIASGLITMVSVVLTPVLGALGAFQNGNGPVPSRELFLPADYAFTIWSVNYVGLFALGVWLLQRAQAANPRARAAAPWLAVTAAANVVWIVLAGSVALTPWTVPALIVMEVAAWVAYLRLMVPRPAPTRTERWLRVPLRIYLGWLSVATIANSAAALNALRWSGWGVSPVTWTLVMIAAATAVAWVVGRLAGHDNVYRAVFVWAFVGITVGQAGTPAVAWASGIAAVAVLGMIGWTWPRSAPGHRSVLV